MKQNNSKGQLTAQIDLGQHVKSGFDYTYPFDGSARIGRIMNTRAMFVNPADTIEGKSIAALQFEPLAVPTLNNMHVKQEHFYVPFNVVWENFDDFISGGEDMDYNGKVPSLSLMEMYAAFNTFLKGESTIFSPFAFLLSYLPATVVGGTNGEVVGISLSAIKSLVVWEMPTYLCSLLDNNQLLDLFDHVQPAIRKIGDYLYNVYNTGGALVVDYDNSSYVILFNQALVASSISVKDDWSDYWDKSNPNKYLAEIAPSVTWYEAGLENAGKQVHGFVIPNEHGLVSLSYLYEVIKPFFGLGSYLDQMNYNKLRFADFIYCVVCGLITTNDLQLGNVFDVWNVIEEVMSVKPQSILPLRAQYCVWWNNYRDQLLETAAMRPRKTDSISDLEIVCLLAPRLRCWHKDTFTTALDSAGTVNGIVPTTNQGTHESVTVKWRDVVGQASDEAVKNDKTVYELRFSANEVFKIPSGYISGMHDDDQNKQNTTSAYFSLDMLEAAKRAQKWLRKSVFYGNRIQDFLNTRFGVKFLDARLKLPELLATSSKLVQLTDVINPTTIVTNESSTVAGDRSAVAHAFDDNGGYFKRYCEEHGVIISNLTVMPDVTYVNTFARELSQLDQFDFPFEEFATLGLDAVYDVELAQKPVKVGQIVGKDVDDMPLVFGYQGRYYNYKAHHGEAHGELLDSQDMYLFARKFNIYDIDSLPKLNYIFVHCHPNLEMFVVDNEFSDYFRYNILHSYSADRLLPVHSLYL